MRPESIFHLHLPEQCMIVTKELAISYEDGYMHCCAKGYAGELLSFVGKG